jgi:hypothetical protein
MSEVSKRRSLRLEAPKSGISCWHTHYHASGGVFPFSQMKVSGTGSNRESPACRSPQPGEVRRWWRGGTQRGTAGAGEHPCCKDQILTSQDSSKSGAVPIARCTARDVGWVKGLAFGACPGQAGGLFQQRRRRCGDLPAHGILLLGALLQIPGASALLTPANAVDTVGRRSALICPAVAYARSLALDLTGSPFKQLGCPARGGRPGHGSPPPSGV